MSSEEQMHDEAAAAPKAETVDENQMDTSEAGNDEDDRKLFVGGLPQDVKDSDLKAHFSTFGEIEGVNLKTDPNTGRSRGFGFVIYKTVAGVESAVALEEHEIKGKKVAVKKAQAKQGKVYVGKLKPELSDEEIKEFFSTYGTIASLEQPFDKTKNERKNFCFITYEKEETARKLLKEGTVTIKGHELEVKKVTPKNDTRGGFGGRGGRGGAGGPAWGGSYGGWPSNYGDYYGWGPFGPAEYYGWGGYGSWGPYPGGGNGGGGGGGMPYGAGGKTPRGGRGGTGGAPRGRGGGAARGQRSKPY